MQHSPMRTVIIDPDEPVVIRGYQFDYQAELARVLLESAGIPCMVLHDTYMGFGTEPVRMAVRRADVEEALALLDAPPAVPAPEPQADAE